MYTPVLAARVLSALRGNPHFYLGMVPMGIGRWQKLVIVVAAACTLAATPAFAQSSTTSENGRKVKTRVAPVYPEIARRMGNIGKVKLEVVITPDGHVKSTRVVGGHPILVQACQDAVKDWKFVPGSEETTQVIEFEFHDQQ
jgi:TonB family protein